MYVVSMVCNMYVYHCTQLCLAATSVVHVDFENIQQPTGK